MGTGPGSVAARAAKGVLAICADCASYGPSTHEGSSCAGLQGLQVGFSVLLQVSVGSVCLVAGFSVSCSRVQCVLLQGSVI